ncbi:MAG TPA: MFS transporter [Clostridiales bacterium]|nr:MFS transporter [Clostridiales bacterium]
MDIKSEPGNQNAVYRSDPFRWGILFLIVPIIVSSEIFWLTFAPIASYAQDYFHTSAQSIDLFAMSYMLMYLIFTLPASWVIERFGYRASLIIGSLVTAVFGIARFAFAGSFTAVLAAQFLIAAAQPFLVNISTKVPANWFPPAERSTASGILVMAQYIGFIVPMIVSPWLAEQYDMRLLLGVYAAIALVSALLAIFFTREKPVTPPGPAAPAESMGLLSMGRLFLNRNFLYVLIISFISMGIFNTIITMIEQIFKPRDISSADAGFIGAAFVISGIIGAVVLPLLSDKKHRRIPFFIIGISLMGLLCAGLTFLTSYPLLLAVAALLGFLIMGLAPILFQHGAEVAYPVQEGASFGLIMLMGQISGVVMIYLFGRISLWTESILWPMLFLIVLAAAQIPLVVRMKESPLFQGNHLPVNPERRA